MAKWSNSYRPEVRQILYWDSIGGGGNGGIVCGGFDCIGEVVNWAKASDHNGPGYFVITCTKA